MSKKSLLLIILLITIAVLAAWWYISSQKQAQPPAAQPEENPEQNVEETNDLTFTPLTSAASPSFIKPLSNAQDVRIDFHYTGEHAGSFWALEEIEFYTLEGSDEKFLSLSKIIKKEGQYVYGPDYYSIFTAEESHSYQGTPIYLLNPDSRYSVSYVGFKINNRDLISELKIEFGIDYGAGQWDSGKSKSSVFASILGIESAYACGPGIYLRPVGSSDLTFVEEENGIAWYRLENPVALYNLKLNYCDVDCFSIPTQCNFWADDPPECYDYYCCDFNASISDLKNGNLRMHVLYKPNDKEGFLQLQMANLILINSAGGFYQLTMGQDFDHYYRAYLR